MDVVTDLTADSSEPVQPCEALFDDPLIDTPAQNRGRCPCGHSLRLRPLIAQRRRPGQLRSVQLRRDAGPSITVSS